MTQGLNSFIKPIGFVKISRRRFLYLLGAIAVTSLAGYYFLFPRKEEKVLKVYNYSYYIDPENIKKFEETYNVKVIYDEYEAAEEAFAKLQLGGGGYDVIILTDEYLPQAIKENLIRKIDKSLIPNLQYLDSRFFETPYDPGLNYSVPYMWGTTGIGYHSKFVSETELEGYEQLFDTNVFLPKHKGKVSMLEEFIEVVYAAKLYLGIPLTDWSDEAIEKIIQVLREQKPFLAGYLGASSYVPGLVNGSLHVAQAWNGDVLVAQEENEDVKYIIPKEGGLLWIDFMVIPRNAKEVELAHAWINFMLSPEVAGSNTNYTYYANPLKLELVQEYIEEDLLENPAVYPPKDAKIIETEVVNEEILKIVERISTAVKKV